MIQKSDYIIYLYSLEEGFNEDDKRILTKIPQQKLITILGNKKDLINLQKVNKANLSNTVLMSIKNNEGE